jgi:tripartite ATP-independent transporter DctM subunit
MLFFVLFLVLLVIGLPIAAVIGITGLVHMISTSGFDNISVVPQRMVSVVNSFTLLAIPLFILAGELMNASGITAKLINLSRSLIGHVRGGLGYVNVMVGLFLGAILGSANAEAAIRSSTIVPEMEKDGYDRDFAAALTATSSTIGPIHPPSITFILYAVLSSTSVGAMFLAGIIPAFLIAAAHFVVIYLYVRKKGLNKYPFPPIKKILRTLLEAIPALLVPIIILGGIFSGFFTPTESGAIACFAAILIGLFYYRTLKFSDLPKILCSSGVLTSSIVIIIATSNILGWSLAFEQLPQKVANYMLSITDSPIIILLLINILLLFVGMFIDITAALLIMVPVLLPVITSLGINPIHFGIVISLNLVIGLCTPPVGTVLYITSNITGVTPQRLIRACIPFFVALIVVLLVVTYIPAISTFLPELFGFL